MLGVRGPFPTFEEAVGFPEDSLVNKVRIGRATRPDMNKYGFMQKWIGRDSWTADWYSAYENPGTNEWAGGKGLSHIP